MCSSFLTIRLFPFRLPIFSCMALGHPISSTMLILFNAASWSLPFAKVSENGVTV